MSIPVNFTGKCQYKKSRFVCISDTHGKIDFNIPDGDVLSKVYISCSLCVTIYLNVYLVHAGDISRRSTFQEFENTIQWLSSLPHK
jgi:hypothetical protein